MSIIRVFPRRTSATPTDSLAFYGEPGLFIPDASEVHISVAFSWDLPKAEYLARAWKRIAPVTIGGPATGEPGGDFIPGRYLRDGYIITSRGCPNACWFCDVWKREGTIKELPITNGWNVLDDNLLACSESHIRAVFRMLHRVKIETHQEVQFTGGLESGRLCHWHAAELRKLRPKQVFFAYDTPDDYEPLLDAGKLLQANGFPPNAMRCYVLIGYPDDTLQLAENRLRATLRAGFIPMAMLYRDKTGARDPEWMKFQKLWARPAIIRRNMRCQA